MDRSTDNYWEVKLFDAEQALNEARDQRERIENMPDWEVLHFYGCNRETMMGYTDDLVGFAARRVFEALANLPE